MVVFGQIGCIGVKLVLFGKIGCTWVKSVFWGQNRLYSEKVVAFG